jgi:hypothetical protein
MSPFWRRVAGAVTAGLAGVLAACGDGPASNVSYKLGPQVWDFFLFAVKDGPVLVIVDGNPFAQDARAVADGVAASMRAGFSEPFVAFTADASAAAHPEYRMIWTLNPAAGYDMNTVCGERRPAVEPVSGRRLEMRVAFCQSGRLLAAVHGWMPAAEAGPGNARWRDLIAQMSRQLVNTEGL